jgi:hypothetical protein
MASEILFSSVNVSPHMDDLRVLRRIAERPTLNRFVRKIIYFEVYFHMSQLDIESYNVHHMRARYPKLANVLEDPTHWPAIQVGIIADALSKMPHVREVVFRNHWLPPEWHGVNYEADCRGFAIYGPRTSRDYPDGEPKPYAIPVKRPTSYRVLRSNYDYGFGIMCRALSMSKTYLHTFSVDYVNYGWVTDSYFPGGFYSETFLSISADDFGYACSAFRHLRKLSLSFAPEPADRVIRHLKKTLARILAAAKKLEELTLNFNESDISHWDWPLTAVLGTNTWPRLRHLCISEKVMDENELTDFLYRHRQTLRSLRLYRVYFDHGNWWTWAEEIRSLSFDHIEFESLGYSQRMFLDEWVPECCLKHSISMGGPRCNSGDCRYDQLKDGFRGLLSHENMIRTFGDSERCRVTKRRKLHR